MRANGRTLRRMTLYLPADLAKRLRLAAVVEDVDVSTLVADAVSRELDRRGR